MEKSESYIETPHTTCSEYIKRIKYIFILHTTVIVFALFTSIYLIINAKELEEKMLLIMFIIVIILVNKDFIDDIGDLVEEIFHKDRDTDTVHSCSDSVN